jgi:hypothetical protein
MQTAMIPKASLETKRTVMRKTNSASICPLDWFRIDQTAPRPIAPLDNAAFIIF